MKQGLSFRMSQQLVLTPQLQQSIRLLQLSTAELAEEIEQQLQDNPFLERVDPDAAQADREAFGLDRSDALVSLGDATADWDAHGAASPSGAQQEAPDPIGDGDNAEPNWEGDGTTDLSLHDSDWGAELASSGALKESSQTDAADWHSEHITLQAHLHHQALGLRVPPATQAALYVLIESINDDGYLLEDLADLAQIWANQEGDADAWPGYQGHLQAALELLQDMDPCGVGAQTLGQCLALQIEAMRNTALTQAAWHMCQQPIELLAKRDAKKLASLCHVPEALAKSALQLIATLEPKPARAFAPIHAWAMRPDVLVSRVGQMFKVQMNPDVVPRLCVPDRYVKLVQTGAATQAKSARNAPALQEQLQEARSFMKNIQQRFDTILRVAEAIVQRQHAFFVHGEMGMRPLVLREIADELGVHESTISRVTTAKYMATPFGTFELKHFFGSGLDTDMGGQTSSTVVRALIRQWVAQENAAKPLSDNQLAELLKAQGIECARRTVAKYREAMRIAPASMRKQRD
jgi:RNA polymerase sigma-54 factor